MYRKVQAESCWVLNVNTDKFLQPRMAEEVGGR